MVTPQGKQNRMINLMHLYCQVIHDAYFYKNKNVNTKRDTENISRALGNCLGLNHQMSGTQKKKSHASFSTFRRASIGRLKKHCRSVGKLSVGISQDGRATLGLSEGI